MEEKKRTSWGGVAILLLLLVALPAFSYVYLSRGYEYRKSAILTMEDHGKMPDLGDLRVVHGGLPEPRNGSMYVVGWLDPTKEAVAERYGTAMDTLNQQFDASENLQFVTIALAENPEAAVAEFRRKHNLEESTLFTFLAADEAAFARTAEAFSLPLGGYDAPGEKPVVALVDSSLTVVKHYDLAHQGEAVDLVELVAVVIPLPERADIIVDKKREL